MAAHVEESLHEVPAATVAEPVGAERTLFEEFEAPAPAPQPAAAYQPAPQPQAVADDLPPPAYAPRQEPEMTEADNFVAPRAAAPGTPSPEALARLQAAVNRVPNNGATPAPQQRASAPAAVATDADKPRFGINSLINRMTGAQAETAPRQPARAQPQVTALREEPEPNEEQDKIEIPAFLRRQAN